MDNSEEIVKVWWNSLEKKKLSSRGYGVRSLLDLSLWMIGERKGEKKEYEKMNG